jgi:hypothetical protein
VPVARDGMPGLASSQSNPSRPPEPVQLLPQDTSFSPVTLTHFALRHWLSLEQKQPPGAAHSLDVPLQLPNGHENPVGVEVGQPPSGHETLASLPATQAKKPASTAAQTAEPTQELLQAPQLDGEEGSRHSVSHVRRPFAHPPSDSNASARPASESSLFSDPSVPGVTPESIVPSG